MAAVSAAIPFNEAELVVHVVGARPNFVKMAPLIEALRRRGVNEQFVVHTGQHYDRKMSDEILEDLGFPTPDYSLGVGSGTHGEQTAKVLMAFEKLLLERRPAVVVVAGDVNSTLACALAASKLGIPVAHLEAGTPLGRLGHAGGDQPGPHRPPLRHPADPQPRGHDEPSSRRAWTPPGCATWGTR